jgi:SAM-dependent methyltransferase
MLGPGFPQKFLDLCTQEYVVPQDIVGLILARNANYDTGEEVRLQPIYGYELWKKIESVGLTKSDFINADVLEICAGTGFLTYHLLKEVVPKSLVINDISEAEITAAKKLISMNFPAADLVFQQGDIHLIEFEKKFDIIIGNSFIHHFYDVPLVLSRLHSLLKPGGVFVSTGEPTYLSPIIEGRRFYFWPIAIFFPLKFIQLIRNRKSSEDFGIDVWVFDNKKLISIAQNTGFTFCKTVSFNLVRTICNTLFDLHLSPNKRNLTKIEIRIIKISMHIDSFLRSFLPKHAFAHFVLAFRRSNDL